MFHEKMKKSFYPLLIASTLGLTALAANVIPAMKASASANLVTVSGTIFNDKNADSKLDSNEEGLAGVRVSDGKSVAVTDQHGIYTLKVDPARRLTGIIFVSLPSGYRVPLNSAKTPQFYANLGELKPGETRKQDFALSRDPKTDSNDEKGVFATVTDVHVAKYWNPSIDVEKERFHAQVEQLNKLSSKPDFVMISGDLTDAGTDEEYKAYQYGSAVSNVPVWTAVGNHEFNFLNNDGKYKSIIEKYRQYQGPEWYSFDYKNNHIVVLENYKGQNEADQLEWLKQDLALVRKEQKVLVVTHIPLDTPLTVDGFNPYVQVLKQYNVKLLLTGHTHSNDVDANVFPGADHVVTSAGWSPQDGSPVGFREVRVGEDKLSYQFKPFDIEHRLEIINPALSQQVPANSPFQTLINAFNSTSEVMRAKYRIDNGGWHSLKRVSAWTWAANNANNENTDKESVNNGNVNNDQLLTEGNHNIEVTVEADNGETWTKQGTFTAVAASKLQSPLPGKDWSTFHGDIQRSGSTSDTVTTPLRLAWSYQSKGTILTSSPIMVQGLIYVGIRDDNGTKQNGVIAIDAKTGQEKWTSSTDAAVDGSPAVSGGIVYATAKRGTIYAFNAITGEKIWEVRTGVQDDGVQRGWTYASPVVDNGVVYISRGHQLLALDAKTGTQKWSFYPSVDGYGGTDRQGAPTVSNGVVYFTGDGRYVVAVSAETGKELWRAYDKVARFRSAATVADGRVYLHDDSGQVVVLDATTGKQVWNYMSWRYNEGRATAAVGNGSVIAPLGNTITSLDTLTGQKQWEFNTGNSVESSPAISGNTVYAGSKDGFLYALDRKTGAKLWQYGLGTWINSSPAVSGNMVVVGGYDGNIYGFVQTK
jgi:outer membrane protein assembly factor BamB/predicted MPP superfamily phosphohydrolase